jgi:hypothetical protein
VQFLRGTVDVEADDRAVDIEIGVDAVGGFAGFGGRGVAQLDLEAVGLGMILQLHRSSFPGAARAAAAKLRPTDIAAARA